MEVYSLAKLILGFFTFVIIQAVTPSLANDSNPQQVQVMQPEEIRSTIQQARNAWIEQDAEAFASLFSPDGEFIVPGDRYQGREAIRQVSASFFSAYSVIKIEIKQIIVEGDRAAVEWYWEDRENATGRNNRADDAIVVDFKAGQIVRWREYIDTATWEKLQ
jgi:uncharacterized protein (TIGR02246 family)